MARRRHFFLIAGEPSGDKLGAQLMAGLKALDPDVQFSGIGGPLMESEGLKSAFPMNELSVMGILEVLPRLPALLRRVRSTVARVAKIAPDALITIDSPDFCLRVAKGVRERAPNVGTIHYVAPTVWAWRPERAAKMARFIDHVLALFPFEPPLMEAEGMTCDFVGHPVTAETRPSAIDCAAFRQSLGVTPDQKLLLVLPGSRTGEINRMEPVFAQTVARTLKTHPKTAIVVPTTANVADQVKAAVGKWPGAARVIDPRNVGPDRSETRKQLAFAAADLALAASGTVSLELARARTPMIIGYWFNWLTTRIVKKKVNLKSATLVNILTDSSAVPEFLFEDCSADNIAPLLAQYLDDEDLGNRQIAAMDHAMRLLTARGGQAGEMAARSVLGFVDRRG